MSESGKPMTTEQLAAIESYYEDGVTYMKDYEKRDIIFELVAEVRRLQAECVKFHSDSGCDMGEDDCEWCGK